jgi:cyanophycinase
MTEYKGTLIPIGGNEDKGMGPNEMYTLDFIERGILSRVVKEAGGTAAKIVVITTASSIPVEVGNNYLHAFRTLGCTHVDVLHIRSIEAAEDLNHLRHIHNADCVLFSGGDQSKIVKYIGNTQMHVELVSRLMDGKFVLAGTSAGAMSMSHEMIAGSGPPESLIKGNIKMSRGMSLLDNVIIDTHFIQRGRFGRLAEAVARHPRLLGIGLAEEMTVK